MKLLISNDCVYWITGNKERSLSQYFYIDYVGSCINTMSGESRKEIIKVLRDYGIDCSLGYTDVPAREGAEYFITHYRSYQIDVPSLRKMVSSKTFKEVLSRLKSLGYTRFLEPSRNTFIAI